MKKIILRATALVLVALTFSAIGFAQDVQLRSAAGDRYVISAKAGGINFIEGGVAVVRANGRAGRLLKGDVLEIGDKVATGVDGKVEILLNPGSYLRLGTNAAFEFTTTSLDDLQLKLDKGSAVFEVFANNEFRVSIDTPKAQLFLIESGIYRVDVLGDGAARLAVTRGRAAVGDIDGTAVKKGRQASVNGLQADVAKFDTDVKDALDVWSRERAKELARISTEVRRDSMRASLIRSFYGNGRGFGWSMYNSFGLWAYDPYWRSYCFLPFGYGWNSPYGYGFGPDLYWYHLPPIVYMPPNYNGGGGGGNGGSGGGGTTSQNGPIVRNPGGKQPPFYTPSQAPYTKIQDDVGSQHGRMIQDNSNFDVSTPSYSPPSSGFPSSGGTTRSDAPAKGSSNNTTKDQ